MRPSFFVLIGDEFLCEEKRKEIIASFQKEFGPDLAVTLRRAGELAVTALLSEARTLPFLAPAQVLGLREADRLSQEDLGLWDRYFQSPHPQTFFIFEAESLEKDHPLLEWARKSGKVFFLRSQSEKMVQDFIRKKLKGAQKVITVEALELLASRVGDSFLFLDSLVDQLILHAGERAEIDRSVVEAYEEKLIRLEGFDLIQALAERDLPKVLEILNDLLESSAADLPPLVGLLHWQLRRFWEARKWLTQGVSEREISSRLRLFPSRDTLFFKHLRRFSVEELEEILEGLFRLDCELKTGRAEGRTEIEGWLVNAID